MVRPIIERLSIPDKSKTALESLLVNSEGRGYVSIGDMTNWTEFQPDAYEFLCRLLSPVRFRGEVVSLKRELGESNVTHEKVVQGLTSFAKTGRVGIPGTN